MIVPTYQREVSQQGLPNVQQTTHVDASNFLGGTQQALMAGAEKGAEDLNKVAAFHYEQQLQEANHTRTLDAINQLDKQDMTSMNGVYDGHKVVGGWVNVQGADVFKQPNGKALADNVMDSRNNMVGAIADSLGNDYQRAQFMEYANKSGVDVAGRIQGHQAQQYRVFQETTQKDAIQTGMQSLSVYNNDPVKMQAARDRIEQASVALAALNGLPPEHGLIQAKQFVSNGLKDAVQTQLQQGNTQGAQETLNTFGKDMDANDHNNAQNATSDNAAATLLTTNPTALVEQTASDEERSLNAVMMQESGGQDYDKHGNPLTSSEGALYKMQVLPSTAKSPGFGIKPAADGSAAESNRVGEQYHHALFVKYDGDLAKVHAAYHDGFGAVDKAIAKYGDNWQAHISQHAREHYIPEVAARMQTGTPFDHMSAEQKLTWNRRGQSALSASQNVAQANLKTHLTNQYAQASNTGDPGDLVSEQVFTNAFGPVDAPVEYAKYRHDLDYAQTYNSVKNMPVAQVQDVIAQAAPQEGSPDFADQQKQYDALVKAAQDADNQRQKDPIAAALNIGFPVSGINWTVPQQAAHEIQNRLAISNTMSQRYGTQPSILTKDEAKNLTNTFEAMPADGALKLMDTLHKHSDPESYTMAMQQLRADSPVTALAGQLYGISATYQGDKNWYGGNAEDVQVDGKKAAETILIGSRILNPTKGESSANGKPPKLFDANESTFKDQFDIATRGAFASQPEAASLAYQGTQAAYAALCAKDGVLGGGSEKINQANFDKALKMVTGGIIEHNDKYVIPPYNMPEDMFIHKIEQGYYSQMNEPELAKFKGIVKSADIIAVGNNVYKLAIAGEFLPGKIDINK